MLLENSPAPVSTAGFLTEAAADALYLKLIQTAQQTVSGGEGPLFSTGFRVSTDSRIRFGSNDNNWIENDTSPGQLIFNVSDPTIKNLIFQDTAANGYVEFSSTGNGGTNAEYVHVFCQFGDLEMSIGGGIESILQEQNTVAGTSKTTLVSAAYHISGPTYLDLLTTNGFLKTQGGLGGPLVVDTNTYLTAEVDNLETVTGRGAATSVPSIFKGAGATLTLGAGLTDISLVFKDDLTANSVTVQPDKLTSGSPTIGFPDIGSVNEKFALGSGAANYVAYWSTANRLTGGKSFQFSSSGGVDTLAVGSSGSDGELSLFSEQGATDRIARLRANTAMTADSIFYLPAAVPAGTYLLTMTSGGVMGFDSSAYLTTTLAASTYVELAGDTMTGGLVLPAGTTSVVPLRIPAGAAHSTPTEGDVWSDSTQKAIQVYADGVKQTVDTALFTATAIADVAGGVEGTAETSLIGTGVGAGLTLPANFLVAGKTIRITARGSFTTAAVPNTITWKLKLGSTAICTSPTVTPLGGASGRAWGMMAEMTCYTTGGSGTVYGQGQIYVSTGTSVSIPRNVELSSTSAVVVDTTATQTIGFTGTLGGTLADTWTITNVVVEIIN